MTTELWRERHAIQDARREEMGRVMKDYDERVYRPAMKSLVERCAAAGHVRGKYHCNGRGWHWYWCNSCGTAMDKECLDESAPEARAEGTSGAGRDGDNDKGTP